MKICGHCKIAKPLEDYAPSNRLRGNSFCRACMNKHVMEYQRRNKDQQAKNVVRSKTRRKILYDGEIVKPEACQRCGKIGPVETHHKSYDQPNSYLDTEFLCTDCHGKEPQ